MSSNFEESLSAELDRITRLPLEQQVAEFSRMREILESVMSGNLSAYDLPLASGEQAN